MQNCRLGSSILRRKVILSIRQVQLFPIYVFPAIHLHRRDDISLGNPSKSPNRCNYSEQCAATYRFAMCLSSRAIIA